MITSLRASVDKALKLMGLPPLTWSEWDNLHNSDLEKRCLRGETHPPGLAVWVSQQREVRRPESISPAPAPRINLRKDPARDARSELLSYLLSKLADNIPGVVSFRKEIIGGKLLPPNAVEGWIEKRSRIEGFSAWLEVPYIADDAEIENDLDGTVYVGIRRAMKPLDTDRKARLRWLEYALPDQPSKRIRTAAHGALERLRILGEQLVRDLHCHPSEATTFILSGKPLPSYPCQKGFVLGGSGRQLGALNKISLTIDPTLSPREVAKIYRQMRSQIFGKRFRAMSEKHIRLALFAFARDPSEPIKSAMTDWNRTYKKWRYEYESNFGRDRSAARRRAFGTLDSPETSLTNVNTWLLGE